MTLASTDLGSRVTYPVGVVPAGQAKVRTTNGRGTIPYPAFIMKDTYTDAATIVTNGLSVSHLGAASAGTTSQTLGGSLCSGGVGTMDVPRNVVITVTHASSIVAMSGTITGTDIWGKTITEDWSVTATGTSKTFTGKKAFKTITAITEVVAADASGNTIISGNGKVLGLSYKAASVGIVSEMQDGAIPTAGVIVAGATAATADARGTYTPNATLDGAKDFVVYYLVDNPTDIT